MDKVYKDRWLIEKARALVCEIDKMSPSHYPSMTLEAMERAFIKFGREYGARLRAERDELRAALKNLVFTAGKLWDDAKPIKDSAIIHATHPIIEQAHAALSRTESGEVGG